MSSQLMLQHYLGHLNMLRLIVVIITCCAGSWSSLHAALDHHDMLSVAGHLVQTDIKHYMFRAVDFKAPKKLAAV